MHRKGKTIVVFPFLFGDWLSLTQTCWAHHTYLPTSTTRPIQGEETFETST